MATYKYGESTEAGSSSNVGHYRRSYTVSDINSKVRNNIPKYSKINSIKFSFDAYQTIALGSTKADGKIGIGSAYNNLTATIAGGSDNVPKNSWTTISKSTTSYNDTSGSTSGQFKNTYSSLEVHFFLQDTVIRTLKLRNTYITFDYTAPTYTISLETNNSNYGTVSGGGTWDVSTSDFTKTIVASAKTGYKFVKWSDGNTNASRNITISQNNITSQTTTLSLTATFEKISCTINFKNQDESIVKTFQVMPGETIGSLPTVSKSGYTFAGWLPCAPAKKVDGNVLDSQKYSNNSFNTLSQQYKYTNNLSIHIEVYMENWMDIVNSQIMSCTESGGWGLGYLANTVGHGFEIYTGKYSGFDLGFGTEGQFSNGSWHSFDIIFSNGILDIYVDGEKKGSQTTSSSTISYNSSNTIFVGAEAGANITTPTGSYFNGIISNVFIANQNSKLEFATPNTIIDRNIDYYPVWRLNPTYAITTKAEPLDGGIVSGSGNYTKGTTITLTAVPNPGYKFIQWSDGSISNPRTLIVNTNKEYTAIFEKNNISIGDVSFKTIMYGDKPVMIFVGNSQLY